MDWYEDLGTELWAFPRGMQRDGGVGEGSLRWTSRFGSVIASGYNSASLDGLNEVGLAGNGLYLAKADYGSNHREGQPTLSVGAWLQYVLDSFANVADAVAELQQDNISIIAPVLPNGKPASMHLAISDASNDSAIFEYLDGQLTIHHGSSYTVMTNSPPYSEQLAIAAYWREVGGLAFLPGTHRAADRFARVGWNLHAVPKVESDLAVATVLSLVRHISVPLGITDPAKPNIASTLWRTLSDHTTSRYYFESTLAPSVLWVDLNSLDLSERGVPRRLVPAKSLAGEVSQYFEPSEPFLWMRPLV